MKIAVVGVTGQVGRRLESTLLGRGHEVVGISRAGGLDASAAASLPMLTSRLQGADVVIDVTNLITQDARAAVDFFTRVARNVGSAARSAGVRRLVLLSIIGVDRIPEDAHYAAKYAQELAYAEHGMSLRIVRSAQFHEFAAMAADWGRADGCIQVLDFPVQSVDLEAVVDELVDAAVGSDPAELVEVAGPERDRLPALVESLLRHRGERIAVVPTAASSALADGACLPGDQARILGRRFAEWLSQTHAGERR